MKAKVSPSICNGSVHIPPSKSMSHRAIICAALAQGKSTITNVAFSQDILTTIEGMRNLGAQITVEKDSVTIEGIKDFQHLAKKEIFCLESGSTLRFFIPIFSLCNQEVIFTGQGRLLQRPQKVYEDIFHEQGLDFVQSEDGIHIHQSLQAGSYTMKGDVSSQFISGLLFVLPLLKEDSTLHILPPFESKSYVDLTLQMMALYGVHASFMDEHTLHIPGNQTYVAHDYDIEGDYSQLAFFAVLAALNHDLTITGVHHDSKQGDKQILSILKDFQIQVDEIERGYHIHKGNPIAHEINLENCPDLGPILCVLAMYSQGETHIYNAGRLRIKESDRIEAMQQELHKFGVDMRSTEDEIFITGKQQYTCSKELQGHNDHRIVMALSIATTCSRSTTTIDDAQAINKSYPAFFEDLLGVNGKVEML